MIYILLCQTHRQTDMVKPPVAKGSNVTNGECAIFFKKKIVLFSKYILKNPNQLKKKAVNLEILGRQFKQLLFVFYFYTYFFSFGLITIL